MSGRGSWIYGCLGSFLARVVRAASGFGSRLRVWAGVAIAEFGPTAEARSCEARLWHRAGTKGR